MTSVMSDAVISGVIAFRTVAAVATIGYGPAVPVTLTVKDGMVKVMSPSVILMSSTVCSGTCVAFPALSGALPAGGAGAAGGEGAGVNRTGPIEVRNVVVPLA